MLTAIQRRYGSSSVNSSPKLGSVQDETAERVESRIAIPGVIYDSGLIVLR
jgi:hypothetical protein